MTDQEGSSKRFLDMYDSYTPESTDPDEDSELSETSNTEKQNRGDTPSETEQTDEGEQLKKANESESDDSADLIEDRKSVMMYLPEDVWRDLDIRFDELNAKHKRQHDEPLEKNRDYYPAVIQAGLTDENLEEFLDL